MNEEIKLIPIDQIRILNPRYRDRKRFEIIMDSIRSVGLKKPIQVSIRAHSENGEGKYDLVCGQGRIEAFRGLGFKEIPAIVVEVSAEERLLRSLVENIARRHPSPMELIREIERLRSLGYTIAQTANKLGVSENTVKGLTALKDAGEQRLLEAAVDGSVPLWVAIDIAKAETPEAQRELLKGFESKQLNRVSIRVVKKLIDQRRFLGKHGNPGDRGIHKQQNTVERMVNAYKRESRRQKTLIQKANICDAKLLFIVTAFNKLVADERFRTLLHKESLNAIPHYLLSKLEFKTSEAA